MKKLHYIDHATAVIFILVITAFLFGCVGEKYNIKSAKVSSPEEVSNTCSQNLGLSESEKEQLSNELKNNDRKFNDEFKLQAMIIISEADGIAPQDTENAQAAYFSCIENSINQSK